MGPGSRIVHPRRTRSTKLSLRDEGPGRNCFIGLRRGQANTSDPPLVPCLHAQAALSSFRRLKAIPCK